MKKGKRVSKKVVNVSECSIYHSETISDRKIFSWALNAYNLDLKVSAQKTNNEPRRLIIEPIEPDCQNRWARYIM
jgi:hypothetical protein